MPVEITEIFYPKARPEWRQWLATHHKTKTEIWLRRFKKATGKPCITYDELVEECLCFGWIDGVVKKLDEESNVQRITPRRKKKNFPLRAQPAAGVETAAGRADDTCRHRTHRRPNRQPG